MISFKSVTNLTQTIHSPYQLLFGDPCLLSIWKKVSNLLISESFLSPVNGFTMTALSLWSTRQIWSSKMTHLRRFLPVEAISLMGFPCESFLHEGYSRCVMSLVGSSLSIIGEAYPLLPAVKTTTS
jgi:hypothetical protein